MAPLILSPGALPPTLYEVTNSLELPNLHLLSINPESTSTPTLSRTLREWFFVQRLLADPNAPEFPANREHPLAYLGKKAVLALLTAFFKFSPRLQSESHILLLSTFVVPFPWISRANVNTPPSARRPQPNPTDVQWKRICDIAQLMHHGLQAARTRTGSAGNTAVSTPVWLRSHMQLDGLAQIVDDGLGDNGRIDTEDALSSTREERGGPHWRQRLRLNMSHFVGKYQSASSTLIVQQQGHPVFPSRPTTASSTDSEDIFEFTAFTDNNVQRSPEAAIACRIRDSDRCALTGRRFTIAAAHIIAYSCGRCKSGFSETYFWLFIRLWLGDATAKQVWKYVGGKQINRLENLVMLTADMHAMFGEGRIVFEPALESTASHRHVPAVVLRVWGLPADVLQDTATLWPEYQSIEQALVAVLETSGDRDRAEAGPRAFKEGELVVVCSKVSRTRLRTANTSNASRDTDMRTQNTPLPDQTLLRIHALLMRLKFEAGLDENSGENINFEGSMVKNVSFDHHATYEGVGNSTPDVCATQTTTQMPSPSTKVGLKIKHHFLRLAGKVKNMTLLAPVFHQPRPKFGDQATSGIQQDAIPHKHQFQMRSNHLGLHARILQDRLAAVQASQLTGEGEAGTLGFERIKRWENKKEEERLWRDHLRVGASCHKGGKGTCEYSGQRTGEEEYSDDEDGFDFSNQ